MAFRNCNCGEPFDMTFGHVTLARRVPDGAGRRKVVEEGFPEPSAYLRCPRCKNSRTAHVREAKVWFRVMLATRTADLVGITKVRFRRTEDHLDAPGSVVLDVPVRVRVGVG